MKKIKTSRELNIPGWGIIPAESEFKVEKFNKRFVYVKLTEYTTLRLAKKADCIVLY